MRDEATEFSFELGDAGPTAKAWKPATIARGERFETVCQKSPKVQRRAKLANQASKLLLGRTGSAAHPTEPGRVQVKLGAHTYTGS